MYTLHVQWILSFVHIFSDKQLVESPEICRATWQATQEESNMNSQMEVEDSPGKTIFLYQQKFLMHVPLPCLFQGVYIYICPILLR